MGVAIEPKNIQKKHLRLIKPSLNVNDKNMVNTKSNRAIYMATTEVFSSLDKVSSHLSGLEKSFKY